MNYLIDVGWDIDLIDLCFLDIDNSVAPGACYQAFKKTAGVPATTAGKFCIGAKVINLASAVWYKNTGTIAVPVWTVV